MNNIDYQSFHIDSLLKDQEKNGERWLSFFKNKNVLSGIYTLSVGDEDLQKPHETDELYYVIEGKAKFEVNGKTDPITTGSILFVKKGIKHRFLDIEEKLVVLVFFDQ